ncbi:hypothetical protein ACO0K2_04230 [Undibacterium sp. MH2W]|uniref:hypothetical protein n=1 Tax=Undibacterium sp. MH2W TaxID=3413044 RepID=UPI003BF2DD6B
MNTFLVTVRTATWSFSYTQIAFHPCDCIDSAVDSFGVAIVTAKPVEVCNG